MLPQGVTILLLGIDARPGEGMLARSDALLVVRLDPQNRVVGMLSLPRDLWVAMPGMGEGKINSAFYLAENAAPGTGPEIARQTISNALGIPIDHHVVVDFRGFRDLIDALEGVAVDVPSELYDAQFPTEDYGYTVAHFLPGRQTMDGATALTYSRIRHPDSDFQRMQRQQAVIMGLARTLQSRNLLTTLAAADQLTASLQPYVHTDMTREQIVRLLWGLRSLDVGQVQQLVVDGAMLEETSIGGAYALVADAATLQQMGQVLIRGQ